MKLSSDSVGVNILKNRCKVFFTKTLYHLNIKCYERYLKIDEHC
jgi:hypothetical protein